MKRGPDQRPAPRGMIPNNTFPNLGLSGQDRGALLKLPCTATARKGTAYIKLIRRILPKPMALCFDGPILCPGAYVKREVLGDRPVLIECAGPIGSGNRGRRDHLYIVWTLDCARDEWIELARAATPDWTWVLALREIAIAALAPECRQLVDVFGDSARIATKVFGVLDEELEIVIAPVRQRSLNLVYDGVAARIASS